MFTTISTIVRSAASIAAAACLLSACGGGGEGLALKPACSSTSDGNVPICSTNVIQYGIGVTAGAMASNSGDYTLTGTRTGDTQTWGAVVGQLNLYDPQDVSDYKSLKLSLASSSNTQVMLMLMSSGAKNGCYPAYVATGLSATAANFTIALTDFALAKNPDPDKCAPSKTTDPDTAVALKNVTGLQVREIKGTTGTNAVNVVIGKPLSWSTDLPVTPPNDPPAPPACSSTSGGNVPICTVGAFQYGVGAAAGAVATNANDYTLTGTRTDDSDAGSTVAGQFNMYAAQNASGYKSLKLSLASSSNTQVMLMLMSSGATNECYPTYIATGLSATAKNVTIALSDFKLNNNPDQGKCAPDKTTDPDTAVALANVTGLQVRETKGAAGAKAVNVVIGKPLLWSMELPVVVEPPTSTTTPVAVQYTFPGAFNGGENATFTAGGTAPWTLTGTRTADASAGNSFQGVMHIGTQPTGDKANTSLKFTLASSGNPNILVRLKEVDPDVCSPSFLATGLTATPKEFEILLANFTRANDLSNDSTRDYAACDATNNPGTAVGMTTFFRIEITDRKQATGTTNINATLSALNWVERLK